jgi:CrcB protein
MVSAPPTSKAGRKFASSMGLTPRSKLMLGVGFCGSFTTFSSFSVDVATWLAQGQTTKAVAYVLTNNVGGVAAATAGLGMVKKIFG